MPRNLRCPWTSAHVVNIKLKDAALTQATGHFKQPYLETQACHTWPLVLGDLLEPGFRTEVPWKTCLPGVPVWLVGALSPTEGRVCTSLGPGPDNWPSHGDFFSGGTLQLGRAEDSHILLSAGRSKAGFWHLPEPNTGNTAPRRL